MARGDWPLEGGVGPTKSTPRVVAPPPRNALPRNPSGGPRGRLRLALSPATGSDRPRCNAGRHKRCAPAPSWRNAARIAPGGSDDFTIRNLGEIATASADSTRTLTALLASIALVSLAVGGIGIMNIMLVSVTERTREIGIRMAVGARPNDVLAQFLVESLVLVLAGGVLGIALGVGIAELLARKLEWLLIVRLDVVLLSVGVSAAVGVIFGLYPALKASRLDPIQALRYE